MRKVIVCSLNHQWKADLACTRSLSQRNDNNDTFNDILTVIEVLLQYALAIPVKGKTGDFAVDAFREICNERKPTLLQTDHGSESINKKTQVLLASHNIQWFETYGTVCNE